MHGLIFKIKESHRQDQSESFVIYRYEEKNFFFVFSQQVKWNHFIMTSVFTQYMIDIYIYSLFHRDETKPTHIIGINSFLFFLMQLIYKHSSPNYQHMINYRKLINKMFLHMCVCISWNIFNCIHFFAICDVILCNLFVFIWYLYIIIWKVDEAASTNFFFFIIYNLFHIASQL